MAEYANGDLIVHRPHAVYRYISRNEEARFGSVLRDLSRIKERGHTKQNTLFLAHLPRIAQISSLESLTSTLSFELNCMALFFSSREAELT